MLKAKRGRTAAKHAGTATLGLAALGVVFGDIGTSPLYVMRTIFTVSGGAIALNEENILGITSAIIWTLLLIVTFKYVGFVLRADHDGVGGILALSTLVRQHLRGKRATVVVALLGVFGASLFFGDSVITPAISVMSAVEGLSVAFPTMPDVVVPVALTILTTLFAFQRFGTSKVGRVFGPIMLVWFAILACAGIPHVIAHPAILLALSPYLAASFVIAHPLTAFIALGAIVLSVSGAEALYADISHFGRKPIQATWICIVLPALALNYLGQAALLIAEPGALVNPFFHLVPSFLTVPLVVMATFATLIASQAVISGAYSTARQAMRLGYLPHMRVVHTSASEAGQIYLPSINWLLYAAVAVVVAAFQSSEALSSAYGLAISMDFVITTTLMCVLARIAWRWHVPAVFGFWALLSALEYPILVANVGKLFHGGWLPLSIALAMMFVMTTWHRGEELVIAARKEREGSLDAFFEQLKKKPVKRIPGTAIYPHSMLTTAPSSLRLNTAINRTLHDHVVIVSIRSVPAPHVPMCERVSFDKLENCPPGVCHITVRYGYMDIRDLAGALRDGQDELGLHSWKLDSAWYILSHIDVTGGSAHSMMWWRKKLFMWISRVSASPPWTALLPRERTMEISTRVAI